MSNSIDSTRSIDSSEDGSSSTSESRFSIRSVRYDVKRKKYHWLHGRGKIHGGRSIGSISHVSSFSIRSSASSSSNSIDSATASNDSRLHNSSSISSESTSGSDSGSDSESDSSDSDNSSRSGSSISIEVPKHKQILTDVDILVEGLKCAGFDLKRQKRVKLDKNLERFRAFYGVGPTATAQLMYDLKEKYKDINYSDCLMGMSWLKLYLTLPVMEGFWKKCDKNISKIVKDYVSRIQSLKDRKIRVPDFHPDEIHIISVDGIHFVTEEFLLNPSSKWFDFKKNSPGLVS